MQRRKKKDMNGFLQMVKMLQALCMAWLNKHRNKETRKLYLTLTHNTIWIRNFKFHSTSPLGRNKKKTQPAGGNTATRHCIKKKTISHRSRKPPNPCPTHTQRVETKELKNKNEKEKQHTAIDRSTARMKSIFSTISLFNRPANKAASFTKFARSALYSIKII